MTKFKKLLSVLLVFVLCFTVCGVIASAAEDPTVLVYTSYANNDASQVRLTIKTSKAYAAIAGTITYEGVTLEDAGHIFAEKTFLYGALAQNPGMRHAKAFPFKGEGGELGGAKPCSMSV